MSRHHVMSPFISQQSITIINVINHALKNITVGDKVLRKTIVYKPKLFIEILINISFNFTCEIMFLFVLCNIYYSNFLVISSTFQLFIFILFSSFLQKKISKKIIKETMQTVGHFKNISQGCGLNIILFILRYSE